jgi:hypothetical protein
MAKSIIKSGREIIKFKCECNCVFTETNKDCRIEFLPFDKFDIRPHYVTDCPECKKDVAVEKT